MAYPETQCKADQNRILLDAYLKGLRNRSISRKIIIQEDVQDVEGAMTFVARYSGTEDGDKCIFH
jgi:hypothetical protein